MINLCSSHDASKLDTHRVLRRIISPTVITENGMFQNF